jgi:hypothetical protein
MRRTLPEGANLVATAPSLRGLIVGLRAVAILLAYGEIVVGSFVCFR